MSEPIPPVAFARFDADGRYVSTGVVPADSITLLEPGIYIGEVNAQTQYHTDAGPVDIPPRPTLGHDFDWVTKTWLPNLDRAKAEKWEEIKAARDAAKQMPLATPYGDFDADPAGRSNIVDVAQAVQTLAQTLAPLDQPTVNFTLHDNTTVTLTAQQMIEVAKLLFQQVQTAHEHGRALRAAIEAATSVEAVEAITWDTLV